jgi:hypothetical protein
MIKGIIHQEFLTIVNIHILIVRAPSFIKEAPLDIKFSD